MNRYYFHVEYATATELDVFGTQFSTPYRAITEAELNLLTYALEAKVHGKPVPQKVAIVSDGRPRKLVALKSTE